MFLVFFFLLQLLYNFRLVKPPRYLAFRQVYRLAEGGAAPGANGAPFHRLYVGNIHFSVTEKDLEQIFVPYGELEQVILQRDTRRDESWSLQRLRFRPVRQSH